MKSIINILLLVLVSVTAMAQSKPDLEKLDTLLPKKLKFIPTGVRIGVDVIPPIRTFTDSRFNGLEFSADIDFYRYYLVAEAGQWKRDLKTDLEDYTNSGNYFRIGADVNFLKKDPEKNMLFFGVRYGHGKFSEELSITSEDPVWGSSTDSYRNTNIKANWTELTTGLKVKVFKSFWMGYTARFKFWLNTNESRGFIPHDVPGYGKTYKDNTWGFNYYILFRIPVRKDEQALRRIVQKKVESVK